MIVWLLIAAVAPVLQPLREPGLGYDDFFPAAADAKDFDEQQLQAFIKDAAAAKTHALVITRGGKIVVERYWDHKPDQTVKVRSITKVLASLAIALLVKDGKIKSLDEPMARWIPEWKDDERKAITLRHVLSHTTGLEPRFGDAELATESDSVRFVASMKLADPPGTTYVYSNQAMELLSEVVAIETKESLAEFVKKRIFTKLGIADVPWSSDRAGHTHGFAGLELRARDTTKIFQMLCDGGRYGKEQLIPAEWIQQATKPQQPFQQVYGLGLELFPEVGYERGSIRYTPWIEARLAAAGFTATAKLSTLRGRAYPDVDALVLDMGGLLDDTERKQLADLVARRLLAEVRPTSDVLAFGHSGTYDQLAMCVKEPGAPDTVFVRLVREGGGGRFPVADRARMTLHPARRCPAFYDANVGEGQCLARGTKDRLIVFLHGMYNPHGSPWIFEDEQRFVEAAKKRGYWVYAPRGSTGAVPWTADWIGFPSGANQLPEAGKFAVELGKWNPLISKTMQSKTATLKPFLIGFSSGAYFSSMLVSQTKLEFAAWALLHGGAANQLDFDKKNVLPTVLVTSRADFGERPSTYALAAKLKRAEWPHRFVDAPGVHALSEKDVASALDLFDSVK